MTSALSLKKLARFLLLLSGTERITCRRHIDSLMTRKCVSMSKRLEFSCQHFSESIRKYPPVGNLPSNTLDYFLLKDPKFARFLLLLKIDKRLHDVPGRPINSNCGYYTENISSFLDYYLQPLSQKFKPYIKDTNHFLTLIWVGFLRVCFEVGGR